MASRAGEAVRDGVGCVTSRACRRQTHGVSHGASHGLSPQGGVPQNNRIGDLDPYALELVANAEGTSLEEVLHV